MLSSTLAWNSLRVLALSALTSATLAVAQTDVRRESFPAIGQSLEVTPGQQFYSEISSRRKMGYRLDRPFKSSMAGAGGFPFSFAIDSDVLLPSAVSLDGNWHYYIPQGNKFRASHGLLGSVIREGDTVGLRVRRDGFKEWFVDNSVYNGFTTIWSRRIKDKDPALTEIQTDVDEPSGEPIQRLLFLGVGNGQLRVRHEQITVNSGTLRDEFAYTIDSTGKSIVNVRGAEFLFQVDGSRARVTIVRSMTTDFGIPVR